MKRHIICKAPYDLRNQNSFFGGWPVLKDTAAEYAMVMTFPVEDWQESAAVVITQTADSSLCAEDFGTTKYSEKAIDQALAALSLDVDDSGWEEVGARDQIIANLQHKYQYLRPALFHSPYEAAAGFIMGQRISVKQRQAIQTKMATEHGQKIVVAGKEFAAFPQPSVLLELHSFSGLSQTKIDRLHGIAKAALNGSLSRPYLLGMPQEIALEHLQSFEGIGPFYASGILYRGAGIVDGVTDDSLTKYALMHAYQLSKEPDQEDVLRIARNWQPYRMWCEVLIHVWLRREIGLPKR